MRRHRGGLDKRVVAGIYIHGLNSLCRLPWGVVSAARYAALLIETGLVLLSSA